MASAKSRWGFRCPLCTGLNNSFNYRIQVVIYIPRWNPYRLNALRNEPRVTCFIPVLAFCMMFAIDLDAYPRFRAKEVEH